MSIKGFKKTLAMGSFAMASAFLPMKTQAQSQPSDKVAAIQQFRDVISSRVINKTDCPTFVDLFRGQLQTMAQTEIGAAVLNDLPKDVNYVIMTRPEYVQDAGFWDGENCVIYDDTLITSSCGASTLIAHETRHAIQGKQYEKDYKKMPAEQQIAYFKMMEIETRLQDVLMKDELYRQNAPGTRTYEFASADWMDYRRLRDSIARENPSLPADKIERMAKTQFVVDSWQGNHQKDTYDQQPGNRTFKDWMQVYNANSLRQANTRCLLVRPKPDMTVDENLVGRHHEIMQEFIGRMGIDVPPDFFDNLKNDKSLMVVRDPVELAAIGKHFDKDLKMVVMPRDNFVPVGGIVIGKDNSTVMFAPEKREEFKKEIQKMALAREAKGASR